MPKEYLFTSERLGFRKWTEDDIPILTSVHADPEVMKHFPSTLDEAKSRAFTERMNKHYDHKGYCYYAAVRLDTQTLIGMIGLATQTFESDFTPCVDIGWRLAKNQWGKGLATEGAKRCLEHGLHHLNLQKILAIAPKTNHPSIRVMQRIGMHHIRDFQHPLLHEHPSLLTCSLYSSVETDHTQA